MAHREIVNWLRLENAAVFVGSLVTYGVLDGSWLLFALLFLVPDVAIAGYSAGPRVGAWCYNITHAYLLPAGLAVAGLLADLPLLVLLALIWMAHIGMDRALGYGLKSFEGFRFTHLGVIGKPSVKATEDGG